MPYPNRLENGLDTILFDNNYTNGSSKDSQRKQKGPEGERSGKGRKILSEACSLSCGASGEKIREA
jgi:hypothetical protein